VVAMNETSSVLGGRVALVTGVSRQVGIGAAVASRLDAMGASVFATGWPPHDAEMPWDGTEASLGFAVARHDLEDAHVPASLVDEVIDAHGRLDIVVAAHARSSSQTLLELTAEELDRSWSANVRSILLLAKRFAACHEVLPSAAGTTGRMLWFTSGQHLGPMPGELPYVATKGALHQLTASLNRALSEAGIVANCINPGPVDTGYAQGEAHRQVASMFPEGRWGSTAEVANLVAFLVGDEGSWIRGQVLNSEGGFDRYSG